MHRRIRPRRCHCCADCFRVEQIKDDGFGTERAQMLALLRRTRRADNAVTPFQQLRDKPQTDGAGRTGDEDAQRGLAHWLIGVTN